MDGTNIYTQLPNADEVKKSAELDVIVNWIEELKERAPRTHE